MDILLPSSSILEKQSLPWWGWLHPLRELHQPAQPWPPTGISTSREEMLLSWLLKAKPQAGSGCREGTNRKDRDNTNGKWGRVPASPSCPAGDWDKKNPFLLADCFISKSKNHSTRKKTNNPKHNKKMTQWDLKGWGDNIPVKLLIICGHKEHDSGFKKGWNKREERKLH